MVGTVSTTPARLPAALARPISACSAITLPLISGEILLPNSTVKAVSPHDRYRTLTSARIAVLERIPIARNCASLTLGVISARGVCHGRHQRRIRQYQLRPGRELRPLGDGQRRRGPEDREVRQRRLRLP